jgi:hypothetical protein
MRWQQALKCQVLLRLLEPLLVVLVLRQQVLQA